MPKTCHNRRNRGQNMRSEVKIGPKLTKTVKTCPESTKSVKKRVFQLESIFRGIYAQIQRVYWAFFAKFWVRFGRFSTILTHFRGWPPARGTFSTDYGNFGPILTSDSSFRPVFVAWDHFLTQFWPQIAYFDPRSRFRACFDLGRFEGGNFDPSFVPLSKIWAVFDPYGVISLFIRVLKRHCPRAI